MKFFYYAKALLSPFVPSTIKKAHLNALIQKHSHHSDLIEQRVNYYIRECGEFSPNEKCIAISDYKKKGQSAYFYDLKQYLYFFPKHFKFMYHFGDETFDTEVPCLFKARKVDNNDKSVLFKMNKHRHFKFIKDSLSYQDKKDKVVWRGAAKQPHRIAFLQKHINNPLCDVGQVNDNENSAIFKKGFLSIEKQLQNKFILAIEGFDVATNLKWAMSSNSVVIAPKPKFETWFMEGTLQSGVHYIQIKDDYSDLDEKVQHYLDHPEEAEEIIRNAHEFIKPFLNKELEHIISYKVLEKYFQLSNQL